MYLIFDVQTTGLPLKKGKQFCFFQDLSKYDSSRIVSIAWIICDDNHTIIDKQYFIIKPDNFIIPQSSIIANESGITFVEAIKHLDYSNIKLVVSHNIDFDINILLSETFRYKLHDLTAFLVKTQKYCTMKNNGVPFMKLSKLYQTYYPYEQIVNIQYNAEYNTFCCFKIFQKMYFSNDKQINEKVINEKVINEKVINEKVINKHIESFIEKQINEKIIDINNFIEKQINEKIIEIESIIEKQINDKINLIEQQNTNKTPDCTKTALKEYKDEIINKTPDYTKMAVKELIKECKNLNITNYSNKKKNEILEMINANK